MSDDWRKLATHITMRGQIGKTSRSLGELVENMMKAVLSNELIAAYRHLSMQQLRDKRNALDFALDCYETWSLFPRPEFVLDAVAYLNAEIARRIAIEHAAATMAAEDRAYVEKGMGERDCHIT